MLCWTVYALVNVGDNYNRPKVLRSISVERRMTGTITEKDLIDIQVNKKRVAPFKSCFDLWQQGLVKKYMAICWEVRKDDQQGRSAAMRKPSDTKRHAPTSLIAMQ
jgi:hypothetical protein